MRHQSIGKMLRQFARIFFQRTCQLHRKIAGQIAMLGIARALQRNVRKDKLGSGEYGGGNFGKKCRDLRFVSGVHGREIRWVARMR
jgi:hypothetical protein